MGLSDHGPDGWTTLHRPWAFGAGRECRNRDSRGTINGLREAHAIALDSEGAFGYITDGPAAQVRIFDRRSFQVVASVPTGPMPRAIVFEPRRTRLCDWRTAGL